MSNPFARLLSQAEINIGDISRRAMDSASAPIKAKSQEIIAEVVSAVTSAARTLAIKAGLGLFAGAMLIVALVFGFSALYRYLEQATGPIEALLIMTGIFAVLAVAAIIAVVGWPSGKTAASPAVPAEQAAAARRAMAASSAAAADSAIRGDPLLDDPVAPPLRADRDLQSGFDAVVSALGDAGFKREQAGLRAGLIIANQLRPMQLVSLALLGGFLAGIRMTSRRR